MLRRLRFLTAIPCALGLTALAGSPALAATPTAATPVQTVQASYVNPQVIATVPSSGTTSASTGAANSYDVKLGGFSALAAYTDPATGAISTTDFWTLTDRGANGTGPNPTSAQASTQGFVVPSFAPEIMHIHYTGSATNTVTVVSTIPFHLPAGDVDPARADTTNPANTASNCAAAAGSFVGPDKLNGNTCNTVTGLGVNPSEEADYTADQSTQLHIDPYGMDSESLAVAPDGSFWVGDEYTPSVVHIAQDGTELLRVVPKGYNLLDGISPDVPVAKVLPASWNEREINKGTEGLAMSPDGTHIYAALQGPINAACTTANDNFEVRRSLRIADLNATSPAAPTLNHEWLYRSESTGPNIKATSKLFISDMSFDATSGRVLVDERGSKGDEASIWAFDPNGPQTDIKNNAAAENTSATDATGAGCFDYSPPANVVPISSAVSPATKVLAANLQNAVDSTGAAAPYNIYKIEGITLLPNGTLAVVNDNDFGYTQSGTGTSTSYADNTATTAGPDSQLREYAIPPLAAVPVPSLPEAPYAVLLPLIALGAIGGMLAVRRRRPAVTAV